MTGGRQQRIYNLGIINMMGIPIHSKLLLLFQTRKLQKILTKERYCFANKQQFHFALNPPEEKVQLNLSKVEYFDYVNLKKKNIYSILGFLCMSNNQSSIHSPLFVTFIYLPRFVIMHGTDTLAYTASALSFMLENLGKTVIVTGILCK